jgi:hypothetical protein
MMQLKGPHLRNLSIALTFVGGIDEFRVNVQNLLRDICRALKDLSPQLETVELHRDNVMNWKADYKATIRRVLQINGGGVEVEVRHGH